MKECPNCKKITNFKYNTCSTICRDELKHKNSLKKYSLNPSYCNHCKTELPYDKKHNKFCNKSCAASYNNSIRVHSDKTKKKISESITAYHKDHLSTNEVTNKISTPRKLKIKPTIVGEFSILYRCTCKSCKQKMLLSAPRQFCNDCKTNHTNLRMRYKFKFNVFHYPNLFNLSLLTEFGWYSPKGKSGKWNPTGLSRDHKISVSEAIKNNYDPYYITHPMNCELMPQSNNIKKYNKCSLTYSALIKLVDEYDQKHR